MKAVLLSGGMDSIALAHWQRPEVAITLDYGQKAAATELAAAAEVARILAMRHETIRIDCSSLGSGDMAGGAPPAAAPLPEWGPFRHQMPPTPAGMRGGALGVVELMVGSVASDGSHADGRAEFYAAADQLMSMQEGGIRVTAPAIGMTTAELIRTSGVSREILGWAHSCHTGPLACGDCRGCHKHFQVTEELYGDAY